MSLSPDPRPCPGAGGAAVSPRGHAVRHQGHSSSLRFSKRVLAVGVDDHHSVGTKSPAPSQNRCVEPRRSLRSTRVELCGLLRRRPGQQSRRCCRRPPRPRGRRTSGSPRPFWRWSAPRCRRAWRQWLETRYSLVVIWYLGGISSMHGKVTFFWDFENW